MGYTWRCPCNDWMSCAVKERYLVGCISGYYSSFRVRECTQGLFSTLYFALFITMRNFNFQSINITFHISSFQMSSLVAVLAVELKALSNLAPMTPNV